MSSKERDPLEEQIYVPTPEELEEGVFPMRRRRRPVEGTDPAVRTRRRSRAGRLFSRLRRGVGQKRTEAQAPRQVHQPRLEPSSRPDPEPTTSSGQSSLTKGPVRESREQSKGLSPSIDQSSRKRNDLQAPAGIGRRKGTSGRETKPRHSEEPDSKQVASASHKRRVRKIAVPQRRPKPTPVKERDPVPSWLTERAREFGHELTVFKQRPQSDPQQEVYASSCRKCGQRGYARRVAPANYTVEANGRWEQLTGPVSERACRR